MSRQAFKQNLLFLPRNINTTLNSDLHLRKLHLNSYFVNSYIIFCEISTTSNSIPSRHLFEQRYKFLLKCIDISFEMLYNVKKKFINLMIIRVDIRQQVYVYIVQYTIVSKLKCHEKEKVMIVPLPNDISSNDLVEISIKLARKH